MTFPPQGTAESEVDQLTVDDDGTIRLDTSDGNGVFVPDDQKFFFGDDLDGSVQWDETNTRLEIDVGTDGRILTGGGGSDTITVRDTANSQDIVQFQEGSTPVVDLQGSILRVDATGEPSIDDVWKIRGTPSKGNKFMISGSGGGSEGWRFQDDSANDTLTIQNNGKIQVHKGNIELPETNSITYPDDPGAETLADITVTSTPSDGTEESYSFDIDANTIAKVYSEAGGGGGIDEEGFVMTAPDSTFPSGGLGASQWVAYLDETNDNLEFKAKYADGSTVKTGTVSLT